MPTVSFSGIASGIDGDAVTNALIEARRLSSLPLEAKIEKNDNETSALEEFNTKLLTLDGALKDFLTLAGSAVAKSADSSNSDVVEVAASANAALSSTTINVLNLARSAVASFDDRFSSPDEVLAAGLSAPATIEIRLGSGDSEKLIPIEINNQTTLGELVSKINEAGEGSLRASHVNAGTESNPEYLLVMNGMSTGLEQGSLSISVASEIEAQGLFQNQTLAQAEDALIDVAGIGQVVRSSNQIGDLIPGLSFDLKQEQTGPVTITVSNDPVKTAKKLGEAIEAVNDLIRYSNENDKVERVEDEKGVNNLFGTLARTRVDDQAIEGIRTALSTASSATGSDMVNVFADLGVTTERDGTLKFDEGTFLEAVGKDPVATDELLHSFADKIGSTSGLVWEYTRFKGTIDGAIDANNEENENINERLARLERSLTQQREMMQKVFSNLESEMGRMQSGSDALVGILAGLGNK